MSEDHATFDEALAALIQTFIDRGTPRSMIVDALTSAADDVESEDEGDEPA